jgi:O-antigen ligase
MTAVVGRRWTPAGVPRALTAPTLALLLVAVGGRYSLDRLGIDWLAWLDLRLVGLAVAFALLAFDLRRVRDRPDPLPRPEGWLVAATLFFGYQLASGLWAPPSARVGAAALDLICMGLLTVAVYLHARHDPAAVARRLLWFFWATAITFALAALLVSGPGAQGRYSAFGGGPNVFVRIQVLGLIAGLALHAIGRPRGIAWSTPLLVVSGLLSGSRGGLLAGMVVGLALLLNADRRSRRFAFWGATAVTAVTLIAYELVPSVRQLVQARFVGQTVQQGYASARPAIWSQTLDLALHHPLIGVGVDGFHALVGYITGTEYPHNYLLAVAAEGGVIGLTLLVITVALWVGTVRRAPSMSVELIAMLASAGYVALAGLFSGDYYDARLAWVFAAAAAALATAGHRPSREQDAPAAPPALSARRSPARRPAVTTGVRAG